MSEFARYAIYYLPPSGDLARFGALWLGWEVETGTAVPQPDVPEIEAITATPRKYGFHGTLKPPFRLAPGMTRTELESAVSDLASRQIPFHLDGLALTQIGSFLALTPVGDTAEIERLAAACVRDIDRFRAPAPPDETARRRAAGLTARQGDYLVRWGYPFVFEEFQFHMTLSGSLVPEQMQTARTALADTLPDLPAPYVIDQIALVGERGDGLFQLIHRYDLTG